MELYLIVFVASAILLLIATKTKRVTRVITLVVAILIPVLFAAFRDETVGTDLKTYGILYWNIAGFTYSSSLTTYIQELEHWGNSETGYALMNWLVSIFTQDIHVLMFFHQFIIVVLIVWAIWRSQEKRLVSLVFLFYLLYQYNLSLSLLRQSIAVALSCLAVTYFFSNRKKFCILVFAAMLFHNSAIFMFLLIFIDLLSKQFSKKIFTAYFVMIVSVVMIFVFYQIIVVQMIAIGLLPSKYMMYVNQIGFKIHKVNLVAEALIIVWTYFVVKKQNKQKPMFDFVQMLAVGSLMFELLGNIVETATRAVFYFLLTASLYAGQITNDVKQKRNLLLGYVVAVLLIFIYICSQVGVVNGNTIPYTSQILGIQ